MKTTQVTSHTCAPGGDDLAEEEEDNQVGGEENEPSSGTPCARSPYVNNNNKNKNKHTRDESYLRETANGRHTTFPII